MVIIVFGCCSELHVSCLAFSVHYYYYYYYELYIRFALMCMLMIICGLRMTLKHFIHLYACSADKRRYMCNWYSLVVVNSFSCCLFRTCFYRCGLVLFSFRFKVICFIIGLWDFLASIISQLVFLSVWMAQWREVLTVFPAGRKSRGWHEGGIPEDLNPAPHAWINHPFVKSQQRRIAYLIWTRGMGFFVCVCVCFERH